MLYNYANTIIRRGNAVFIDPVVKKMSKQLLFPNPILKKPKNKKTTRLALRNIESTYNFTIGIFYTKTKIMFYSAESGLFEPCDGAIQFIILKTTKNSVCLKIDSACYIIPCNRKKWRNYGRRGSLCFNSSPHGPFFSSYTISKQKLSNCFKF